MLPITGLNTVSKVSTVLRDAGALGFRYVVGVEPLLLMASGSSGVLRKLLELWVWINLLQYPNQNGRDKEEASSQEEGEALHEVQSGRVE